ncbi:hypothetical protein D7B24_007904 [Verticillium nonalfalfae]|uniref:Manganese transporter smf1 n=1 Tax=Verticillium nonalfalfae TaxID=1051616 RepID=A0A3M9Y8T2_9PEZI|nr:uncharacterized protein D7B24_007904 [Verticillium nonalfalfae]RNJ55908.1 hypothetical protein D7B24_007904 [Verticillium nonalfalfae]
MNRPSRTDEPYEGEGHNQSPNSLPNDLTTNEDLNGIANAREARQKDELLRFKNGPPWKVIGFAIALNLLIPAVPLVVGCAISILDVFVTLYFYNPQGSMKGLRIFECFIACLVLSVVVCFCIQLSMIKETPVGDIFKGYLPSKAIIQRKGLYQACGILGATVMPHSLYLGSGIVQPRLREFDAKNGLLSISASTAQQDGEDVDKSRYVPSLKAIRHAMTMSSFELGIALFTFALFVNSAILIVAGDSLYGAPNASDADIFSIHELLSQSISTAAGTMFALALLLSGVSAGIVCTIAGQMVCEGALNWKMRPWLRRLVTRSISITPSVIIAGAVGRQGISAALNASQVVLSVVLPFLTAPLIYFTGCGKFMTVQVDSMRDEGEHAGGVRDVAAGERSIITVQLANSWYTTVIAVLVWIAIASMNVANLVLLGQGN